MRCHRNPKESNILLLSNPKLNALRVQIPLIKGLSVPKAINKDYSDPLGMQLSLRPFVSERFGRGIWVAGCLDPHPA